MNWEEIRLDNINAVNAEIQKSCEVYCVLHLAVKLKKQKRIRRLADETDEDEDKTTAQIRRLELQSQMFLEKLNPEWSSADQEVLVKEMYVLLEQRLQTLEIFMEELEKRISEAAQSSSDSPSSRDSFVVYKRLSASKKKLRAGVRWIEEILRKYPLEDLKRLDEAIRQKVVSPQVLQQDFWEREDDDARAVDLPQDGTRLDADDDALATQGSLVHSNLFSASSTSRRRRGSGGDFVDREEAVSPPKKVVYRILLTRDEFEQLKELRKAKGDTHRFLLRGEGTLNARTRIPARTKFVSNESKFLFSSEPYRDPATAFTTYGGTRKSSKNRKLRADGINVPSAVRGGAGRRGLPVRTKAFSSITRSLATSSLDKSSFLGEGYRSPKRRSSKSRWI